MDGHSRYNPCHELHQQPYRPVDGYSRHNATSRERLKLHNLLKEFRQTLGAEIKYAGCATLADYLALQRVPALQQPMVAPLQAANELLMQIRAFNRGQVTYDDVPFLKTGLPSLSLNAFPAIGECSWVMKLVLERMLANNFPKFIQHRLEPRLVELRDMCSEAVVEANRLFIANLRSKPAHFDRKPPQTALSNKLPIPVHCQLMTNVPRMDLCEMPSINNNTVFVKYHRRGIVYHTIIHTPQSIVRLV